MDDRLKGIESGLSRLEEMLTEQITLRRLAGDADDDSNAVSKRGSDTDDDHMSSSSWPTTLCSEKLSPEHANRLFILTTDRDTLLDNYYGPSTLFSLCSAFAKDSRLQNKVDELRLEGALSPQTSRANRVDSLLSALCHAAKEVPLTLPKQTDQFEVRLPPKQFLLLIANQYFKQEDYRTDLFTQQSFLSNINRLYGTYTPSEYGWAVAFHTIILLTLGETHSVSHGSDPAVESQFALPFRQTVELAISHIQSLMQPKLINIQALALLVCTSYIYNCPTRADISQSVAAQEFYCPRVSESLFMSACMLAKSIGLDQVGYRRPPEMSIEEHEERVKVFRSLYLRDKSLLICRGSICWLPTFDLDHTSSELDFFKTSMMYSARLELAFVQDDIYQSFRSAKSAAVNGTKRQLSYTRICQALDQWQRKYQLLLSTTTEITTGCDKSSLHLEFLSTRISVLSMNSETSATSRAVADSRASCALIMLACGNAEPSLRQKVAHSFLIEGQNLNNDLSGMDSSNLFHDIFPKISVQPAELRSLASSLSAVAIFVLANNILYQEPANSQEAAEDLTLLQGLCAVYKDHYAKSPVDGHRLHIGHTLELLLDILRSLSKDISGVHTPEFLNNLTQDASWTEPDLMTLTNDGGLENYMFSSQMSPLLTTPAASTWSTPPVLGDRQAGFSRGFDTPSDLMLPMEMEFLSGAFDSNQQHLLGPFPNSDKINLDI